MKKTFYLFGYLVSCTKIILPLNLLKSIFRYIYSGMKFYNIKDRKNMVLCKYPFDIIGARNISIGENSSFGKRCVLTAWENLDYGDDNKIRIGNNVVIGDDCHITAVNGITISDGCLLGKKITITDNSHGKINLEELSVPPVQRVDFSKGKVFIGTNVWIGDKVSIMPNVIIGDGAIIGANAVVTTNIPSYSVAVGIPAKVIKTF
jgi:acetyltransferase-like isoleucine patch superfamily enzyme